MAQQVSSAGSIAIEIGLSKAQIAKIWPGLDFIARSYMTRQRTGRSPASYPFQIYPMPRGFDSGTFSTPMMDRLFRLREQLLPKAKTGGQFTLDAFQLRAAAFAARVTRRLKRMQIVKPRKKGASTLPTSDREKRILTKQAKETQRTIRHLERVMKSAVRRFMKEATPAEFRALSEEWQSHLRWMKFRLTFFKHIGKFSKSIRYLYQDQISCLIQMAERAILDRRFQLPSAKSLRHAIRVFLNYSRRARVGPYDHVYILRNSESPAARARLFEFLEPQLYLRRAS